MRRFLLIPFSILLTFSASAQIYVTESKELERQIVESGTIHFPLPLCRENSYENNCLSNIVLYEESLYSSPSDWSFEGTGKLSFRGKGDDMQIIMEHPVWPGNRAQGPPDDPDYATYGLARAKCKISRRDLDGFNRIYLKIYPDCEGAYVTGLNLTIGDNDAHLMNLVNEEWNTCVLSLDNIDRESIEDISIHTTIKGGGATYGDSARFIIADIKFQKTESNDSQIGWNPDEDKIILSYSGYMPDQHKTAIVSKNNATEDKTFTIEDIQGNIKYEGKIVKKESCTGHFGILDFSEFAIPGEYIIKTESLKSKPFRISEKVWEDSKWRVLNFIFCQRCGYAVPGIHDECHKDMFAVHNGKRISYGGGWHDAGDLSQQTLQTGDVTFSLFESYLRSKEENPLLAARLLEEARWGIEFVLRSRFGDGWRASSMGLLHWTDGKTGTFDDIVTVRKQNLAFDNFLLSGYEAFAAMHLPDDTEMKNLLCKAAKEDFNFAMTKFEKDGFDDFLFMYEHSYNTSKSQYMATISWSASMLYQLTGEKEYAEEASSAIRYTIECQRKEPLENGLKGWFYRSKEKESIVHFIHQSREQIYMQAFELLCTTQPEHVDKPLWEESMRLYGEYLKGLMKYTEPYGLIPSGVWNVNEWKDKTGFSSLHIFAPEDAEKNYIEQVKNGVYIDGEHYVRCFPVWLNIFNGNTAIHLSTGKAAAICGKYFKDSELMQIAAEQLYWTTGKNPFGQSLIYGEGYNYPSMSSFSSGEITGEIPVGIRSYKDKDIPYWPDINNACYKEVWTTSAGKWLSLTSEF